MREFCGRVLSVLLHEAGALDKHAAGTAGGVEHAAVIRLENLDDQADDAARREELAALLPFRARELAEEIFVDPAEGVVFEIVGISETFFSSSLSSVLVKIDRSWAVRRRDAGCAFRCPRSRR